MVFTRAQSDTISREELVEELIKCSNIADQIKIPTGKDKVIIKFKKRKQRNDMIFKRKELKSLLMIFLHSSLVDCCLLPTACVSKTRFSFINADS